MSYSAASGDLNPTDFFTDDTSPFRKSLGFFNAEVRVPRDGRAFAGLFVYNFSESDESFSVDKELLVEWDESGAETAPKISPMSPSDAVSLVSSAWLSGVAEDEAGDDNWLLPSPSAKSDCEERVLFTPLESLFSVP